MYRLSPKDGCVVPPQLLLQQKQFLLKELELQDYNVSLSTPTIKDKTNRWSVV